MTLFRVVGWTILPQVHYARFYVAVTIYPPGSHTRKFNQKLTIHNMSCISLLQQGFRFGIVGILATLLHVCVYVSLVAATGIHPSLSNVIAFVIAFGISFIGHFHWTFASPDKAAQRAWGRPLLKFIVVAVFGFFLNALAVYFVTDVAEISYLYATVFMVTVTPVSVFVLSKLWAFS